MMKNIPRRTYIGLVGNAIFLSGILASTLRPAYASAKIPKLSAGYVNHAASSADCSSCANFVKSNSTCLVVAGIVSPNGFCNYYSPNN